MRIRLRRKPGRNLLAPRTKVKKLYWEFHKGDADYRPSVPHGHSLDGKYKLELWSGEIYDCRTGKKVMQAKEKDMLALSRENGFADFVNECRAEYLKLHPGVSLQPLSGNIVAKKQRVFSKRSKKEKYLVCLEVEDY